MSIEHTVTRDDTAVALGSGDVEVLATPRVVALCEAAALEALGDVADGLTTVGTRIVIDHLAPTSVGRTVVARAELEHQDGKTLSFRVEVSDASGVVARGTHTRVLVDRERFMKGANDRR